MGYVTAYVTTPQQGTPITRGERRLVPGLGSKPPWAAEQDRAERVLE